MSTTNLSLSRQALATAIADAIQHYADAAPTEMDVAKAIRDGELSSPQTFGNLELFDVRVTGTGTSYRQALDEYVYRPPEDFLSDDFVERCNGLPVVFEHPKSGTLDTDEYRQRAVGTIVLPYVKGDEVWGIAKIYDADAATLMRTTHASTSPAVVFHDASETEKLDMGNGQTILIEGKPSYLDHLAICEEGVWDKGGEPKGVNLTKEDSAMAEEDKVPAWADALSKRLDAIDTRLDSFDGLVHKLEEGGKSKEYATKIAGKVAAEKGETGKRDAAEEERPRKDESEEAEEHGEEEERDEHKAAEAIQEAEKEGAEEREDAEEEEGKKDDRAGDSQRSDSEGDCKMDAQARENASLKRLIADMDARMQRLTRPVSAADRDELARVHKRADSLAQMFGDSATPPLAGETPIEYRKRMAAKFQKFSDSTKGIKVEKLDEASFAVIEDRIFADAQAVAASPDHVPEGKLLAIKSQDAAGRTITQYHGSPKAWLKPFMAKNLSIRFTDSQTLRQGVK